MESTQNLSAKLAKLEENVLRWEQRLQSEPGGTGAYREAVSELRLALDGVGRVGFRQLAQACEVTADTLVVQEGLCRFKQVVDKEWMTLWGKGVVPRRLCQADRGGPSRVPLDRRCGMVSRTMVPGLERVNGLPRCTVGAGRSRGQSG